MNRWDGLKNIMYTVYLYSITVCEEGQVNANLECKPIQTLAKSTPSQPGHKEPDGEGK